MKSAKHDSFELARRSKANPVLGLAHHFRLKKRRDAYYLACGGNGLAIGFPARITGLKFSEGMSSA